MRYAMHRCMGLSMSDSRPAKNTEKVSQICQPYGLKGVLQHKDVHRPSYGTRLRIFQLSFCIASSLRIFTSSFWCTNIWQRQLLLTTKEDAISGHPKDEA